MRAASVVLGGSEVAFRNVSHRVLSVTRLSGGEGGLYFLRHSLTISLFKSVQTQQAYSIH